MRLADVEAMMRGQQTELFLRNAKHVSEYSRASFSLICPHRTVDLICEDLMVVDTWYRALQILVEYNIYRTDKEEEDERCVDASSGHEGDALHANGGVRRAKSFNHSGMAKNREDDVYKRGSGPAYGMTREIADALIHGSNSGNGSGSKTEQRLSGVKKFFAKRKSSNSSPILSPSQSQLGSPRGGVKVIPAERVTQETMAVTREQRNTDTFATLQQKDDRPHITGEDKKLLEFVAIVGINESTVPTITYSFPPLDMIDKKENKNILDSLPLFCFPDIETMKKTTSVKSKTYSFVLTGVDGSRRFGYCKRALPSGRGARWPVSYCIISSQYVTL